VQVTLLRVYPVTPAVAVLLLHLLRPLLHYRRWWCRCRLLPLPVALALEVVLVVPMVLVVALDLG
jgi:hypothetical protein